MNKYSFLDILEKEIIIDENKSFVFEEIKIPMIQRDYAQGRISEIQIRSRFLNAIFDALRNGENLNLDFVYGSINEVDKVFIPLDGQQRLTTLFLLHWYITSRELDLKDKNYLKVMGLLKKFTYYTRPSSSRFCEELVKTKIEFTKEPKEEITNLPWFFKLYQKDPTVSSMLNMLDAIHEKYKENNLNLFEKLDQLKFYILPLNGFNLTEELYVKMNARGKQLTDFENLKADLTNWMKEENNPHKNEFKKRVFKNGREMFYYLSFSLKMDNEWTNFFWNISKDYNPEEKDKKGNLVNPEGKIIDPLFLRVFYRYLLNKYIFNSKSESKIIDKELDFQILNNEGKYQNFSPFKRILSTENHLTLFEKFLDQLTANWGKILESIQPSWLSNKWSFYDKLFTQSDRIVFLGLTLYLEKNVFDEVKFKQWMRIVWNIVENTDITDASSMIGVMKLIIELSNYSDSIYSFLEDENNQIASTSSKIAILEERKKSKFILKDLNWEKAFIYAEKHPFFRGSIGFIMTDDMTLDIFQHRTEMASKVYDSKGISEEYRKDGHLFLRALISRFSDNSLIDQKYTDTDESEHYLKKMMSSNDFVKNSTREWFGLSDETELKKQLIFEVGKDSVIEGWYHYDEREKIRIRRAHEALYKLPDLQDWMQKKQAFRLAWSNNHLWVSRPRSWYDWVMLDSIRNIIISQLIEKGFNTETDQKLVPSTFYIGSWIILVGKVENTEIELKFIFNNEKDLNVLHKSNDEFLIIKKYDYVEEDVNLMTLLEDEIFTLRNLNNLINKAQSTTS